MLKRLIAIAVIFCGASVAWMILGGTLLTRTSDSDSSQLDRLTAQWGSSQTQYPPEISARIVTDVYNKGAKTIEHTYQDVSVPLRSPPRVALSVPVVGRYVHGFHVLDRRPPGGERYGRESRKGLVYPRARAADGDRH
jgi:hypothetical protein